jgi:RimJ/RimL family protein N-acetyltransferase
MSSAQIAPDTTPEGLLALPPETALAGAFRKLSPADRTRIESHLLALDADDRASRFQGYLSDDAVRDHVRRLNWFQTAVIGYEESGKLRGVAEVAFDRYPMSRSAEMAVTVESAWQGRGVGSELAYRAITIARNRGARRLEMLCLTENRRMQRIAKRLSSVLDYSPGSVEAAVGLARATPMSLWLEAVQDGASSLLTVFDRAKMG